MSLDLRLLEAIADWEDRSPGLASITVEELAELVREEPVKVSRGLRRLVDSGQVDGLDVTTFGSSYSEYHVTGITASGKHEVDRVRSGFPALTGGIPPLRPVPSVVINMSGGSIGSVSGQVLGNIQNNLNAATGPDSDEFRAAMAELIAIITTDVDLAEEQRTDAIEAIEAVAIEGARPAALRKRGAVVALLLGIPAILTTANQAHEAWGAYVPAIRQFFGI
jgi:hypothetical protein